MRRKLCNARIWLCYILPVSGVLFLVMLLKSDLHHQEVDGGKKSILSNYKGQGNPIPSALQKFSLLMEVNKINVTLIEPFILFHLLPQDKKEQLRKRGFNLTGLTGASNIVTLAVLGKESRKFRNKYIHHILESSGFRGWMVEGTDPYIRRQLHLHEARYPTHHLYVYKGIIIHVVVFHPRARYLWHAEMNNISSEVLGILKPGGFVFGQSAAAFERFDVQPTKSPDKRLQLLSVPVNIEYFLFQLPSSRFVECNLTDSPNPSIPSSYLQGNPPAGLFEATTEAAVSRMKALLHPKLVSFWLSSGTLLGWYRQCGIIPYTSDVDFCAWASNVNDDLINSFQTNSDLTLLGILGQPEEDLEFWLRFNWLRIDLFFMYDDGTKFWVGGHRPEYGYSFRYIFPKFSLCSAEFLGHKVEVPCDPEPVLEAEYGPDWGTPVAEWNYESSARNVLGRRYWTEKERRKFLAFFKERKHEEKKNGINVYSRK